jgi:FkbM family methyltransferase
MKFTRRLLLVILNNSPALFQGILESFSLVKTRIRFDFETLQTKIMNKNSFSLILIGANDGISFDYLFEKLDPLKTKGLVIEPSPKYFQSLNKNLSEFRGLSFLNYALYKESSSVSLFQLNENGLAKLPEWGRGIGSFSKDHLLKFSIEEDDLEELKVEGIPFMDIIENHPEFQQVDYLQIDTEGYDAEIIKMIDFKKFEAKMIKFESINLKEEEFKKVEEIFLRNNYRFFKGKEDSFALHKTVKPLFK